MSLRSRWTLIFGPGVHELRKLLGKLGNIDMFIHDSNHTYLNQLAEYRTALAWMDTGAILISDDIGNDALMEASEEFSRHIMIAKQGKSQNIGIIV